MGPVGVPRQRWLAQGLPDSTTSRYPSHWASGCETPCAASRIPRGNDSRPLQMENPRCPRFCEFDQVKGASLHDGAQHSTGASVLANGIHKS